MGYMQSSTPKFPLCSQFCSCRIPQVATTSRGKVVRDCPSNPDCYFEKRESSAETEFLRSTARFRVGTLRAICCIHSSVGCESDQRDSAGFKLNQEQDVGRQASPGEHFNSEEVHAGHDEHVRSNEVFPANRLAALGCGSNAVTVQNVPHGLIADAVAEVCQRAHISVTPPTGVLFGTTNDEVLDLPARSRATWIGAFPCAVELLSDQLSKYSSAWSLRDLR